MLSGDGLHAYATTAAGDLLAIDTGSDLVQRLLPDAPLITQFSGPVVPGSLLTLSGSDLSSVSIGGLAPPVLLSSPTSLTIQVPWEIGLSDPVAVITAATESPFEQATIEQPVAAAPQFLGFLHADLRNSVSDTNPAHPGEILAAFLTGARPGEPSGRHRTARVSEHAELCAASAQLPVAGISLCQTKNSRNLPATVLFAGLAPGLLGVYQVNVEVPANIMVARSLNYPSLICTSTLPSGGNASSPTYLNPRRTGNSVTGAAAGGLGIELNGP